MAIPVQYKTSAMDIASIVTGSKRQSKTSA